MHQQVKVLQAVLLAALLHAAGRLGSPARAAPPPLLLDGASWDPPLA